MLYSLFKSKAPGCSWGWKEKWWLYTEESSVKSIFQIQIGKGSHALRDDFTCQDYQLEAEASLRTTS